MDTLLSAAHLRRELGEELFNALINSDNTGKVKDFAETLVKTAAPLIATLPTEMTVAGRVYEILTFLEEGEESVTGKTMAKRVKKMNASLGKEVCEFILDHQDEIPSELRGKVAFVFTVYQLPEGYEVVACVNWDGDRWVRFWGWLGFSFHGGDRVLRRK